jgi:methylamine dehydrogenase accessory protein MauD
MAFLIASQIALWIAVAVLGLLCIALARQVGVLHERIAPAGALMISQPALAIGKAAPRFSLTALSGAAVEIGGARAGRAQLVFFLAPDCPVCKALLPSLRSAAKAERSWLDIVLASDGEVEAHAAFVKSSRLESFDYVLSEALGRAFGVAKLPYAALIDPGGLIASMGLINTREHLESLFEAKERGVASLQDFLAARDFEKTPA